MRMARPDSRWQELGDPGLTVTSALQRLTGSQRCALGPPLDKNGSPNYLYAPV